MLFSAGVCFYVWHFEVFAISVGYLLWVFEVSQVCGVVEVWHGEYYLLPFWYFADQIGVVGNVFEHFGNDYGIEWGCDFEEQEYVFASEVKSRVYFGGHLYCTHAEVDAEAIIVSVCMQQFCELPGSATEFDNFFAGFDIVSDHFPEGEINAFFRGLSVFLIFLIHGVVVCGCFFSFHQAFRIVSISLMRSVR